MDFDPTVFEINEADVFALEDENLTYENSFDMTWFKNNVQNLRGYLFLLSLPKNFILRFLKLDYQFLKHMFFYDGYNEPVDLNHFS